LPEGVLVELEVLPALVELDVDEPPMPAVVVVLDELLDPQAVTPRMTAARARPVTARRAGRRANATSNRRSLAFDFICGPLPLRALTAPRVSPR